MGGRRRSWPEPRSVIAAVGKSGSVEEACARVGELRDAPTSENELRSWFNQYAKGAAGMNFARALGSSAPPRLKPKLPKGASRSRIPEPDTGYWMASETAPKDLVIIPDIHFPYHHAAAVEAVLEFIRDTKPEAAVQLGDAFDFYGVSIYPKKPAKMRDGGARLIDEVKVGKPFFREVVRIVKEVHYLPGNHEERIQRNVVQAYPALDGLPAFDLPSLLELPPEVKCHGYGVKLRIGNLTVTHGDKLRRGRFLPKYPAAMILAKYPDMNLAIGHTHKIDRASNTIYYADGRRHFAARYIGWLGDASKIDYEDDPDYQLGFAYVEFWRENGKIRHTFHQIEMVDGCFSWNGKVYGAKKRGAR